jgi:hypothetical protein
MKVKNNKYGKSIHQSIDSNSRNCSKLVKMIENLWCHSIRDFRTINIEGLIMQVQGSNESNNPLENLVPVKTDQPYSGPKLK